MRLPRLSREAIEETDNDLLISAASAWEIAAKSRKGKLPEAAFLVTGWNDILAFYGVQDLPVESRTCP